MKTYTESTTNLHNNDALWKQAIRDAEVEIKKAKRRIACLRESIRIFEKKAKTGEPWPNEPSTQN
jgi:phage shock protein A